MFRGRFGATHRAVPATASCESLFVENLAHVERVASALARRHHLHGDDASDFASWTKLRLVEDNYAILRKFRGESNVRTYLTVVLAMLARDYRAQRWGRWRPSVAARRSGTLAVSLETLVCRDGFTLRQAGEWLRTSGATALTDAQLGAILGALPLRDPMRPVEVGETPLDRIESQHAADSALDAGITRAERERAERALGAALGALPTDDRVMLRMHYWDGLTLAEISRAMAVPQKPLYRRLTRALGVLRERLVAAGIDRRAISELLGDAV